MRSGQRRQRGLLEQHFFFGFGGTSARLACAYLPDVPANVGRAKLIETP